MGLQADALYTYVYVSQVVTIVYCPFFTCAASQGIGKEIALEVRALNRAVRGELEFHPLLCSDSKHQYAKYGAEIVIAARRESQLLEVKQDCLHAGASQVWFVWFNIYSDEVPASDVCIPPLPPPSLSVPTMAEG